MKCLSYLILSYLSHDLIIKTVDLFANDFIQATFQGHLIYRVRTRVQRIGLWRSRLTLAFHWLSNPRGYRKSRLILPVLPYFRWLLVVFLVVGRRPQVVGLRDPAKKPI